VNPEDGLPESLRGAATITPISAGLSGARVFRVEAAGRAYVLKLSPDEPGWPQRVAIQQRAAEAGLAPEVVHVDRERRAVLSAFAVNQSLPAALFDPGRRSAVLALLGRTIGGVHLLPLPSDVPVIDPRSALVPRWAALADWAVPAATRAQVERVLGETPPIQERAPVLSHNDVNPSNLAYDGERLLLIDWDMAGANDPMYDLATAALFLRLAELDCRAVLAAHDGVGAVAELPPRFGYNLRLVSALCGTIFLTMARAQGHAGGREGGLSLQQVYVRLRAGELNPGNADGAWAFGVALIGEGAKW
jgi:Ser/Thr protein kinase RdoA (MazF antagonist)